MPLSCMSKLPEVETIVSDFENTSLSLSSSVLETLVLSEELDRAPSGSPTGGSATQANTRPRRLVEVNVARHYNLSTQYFCTVHCQKSHGRTLAASHLPCTIGVMVPGMHRRSRDTASGDHDSHEHARTAWTRRGLARERLGRLRRGLQCRTAHRPRQQQPCRPCLLSPFP